MTKIRYKILHGDKSENGNQRWELGKWYRIDGTLFMCNRGFHCSRYIQDAMSYVQGDTLAVVNVRGEHLDDSDKECWREMRVVKTYALDKVAAVMLAIASAELALPNYEKIHPDDKRPRLAIEAAKKWLKEQSGAAESAAEAAWSAASAAESAAEAARSAASAAWSAASAASAAWSAARSAASAAWSAARSAAKRKLHAQLLQFLKRREGKVLEGRQK